MPIYEYRCADCGHELEVTQKMSDPVLKTCPSCSKESLEKLISRSAFQLKGGGWYSDLYSSSGASGSKTSAAPEKSSTESSSTPAAASAPAASSEAKSEKKAEKSAGGSASAAV